MRAIIQRVSEASVSINNTIKSEIQHGFLVLLGVEENDTNEDIQWLSRKIIGLRIFSDENDKMNRSIKEINGDILVISQFTLFASTKKGNRPSFIRSAKPNIAKPIYELFVNTISNQLGKEVGTGQFGADMNVKLINDGPVTIFIDTKNKE